SPRDHVGTRHERQESTHRGRLWFARSDGSRKKKFSSLGAGNRICAGRPANLVGDDRTDPTGLTAGEIRIPTDAGEIPGYRAMPSEGRAFPAVLVVQEIFG